MSIDPNVLINLTGEITAEAIDKIPGFTTNTPGHADYFNNTFQKLINNDKKLASQVDNLDTVKTNKTYVDSSLAALDTKINSQASGSPKGVYATVPALTAAYPTGNTNIYLVIGDVKEVDTLTVTATPTVAGNVTISLNGVNVTVALDPATDTTTAAVATKIRNAVYSGWTTGGTGSTVTFTKTTSGTNAAPTFSAGSTGATASIVATTAGVAIDGKWYYWNGSAWAAGGTYQSTGLADKGVTPTKASFQQIDLAGVTYESGYYINRLAGTKVSNTAEYYASSYIDLPYEGLTYVLKTCTTSDYAGLAFYDANNAYIGGLITGYSTAALTETEFTVPAGAKKMRFTCVGTDKLPGILLAVKSNSIAAAKAVAAIVQANLDAANVNIAAVSSKASATYDKLFRSYFYNTGTIADVPDLFKNIASYVGSAKGTVALANNAVTITAVTSQASGGSGFRIVLPDLTPEAIKHRKIIQLEMDLAMATPINVTFNIGVYALKKDANGVLNNSNAPLLNYGMTVSLTASQHISKTLALNYDDIISKVVAAGDITLDQINCFGIYVNYFSIFSSNTITFSNIYIKNTDTEIRDDVSSLQGQVTANENYMKTRLYSNYELTEEETYNAMTVFRPTKGTVTIDKTAKTVTIDNTTDLNSGSAGVVFPLAGFYELMKEMGSVSIDFTGRSIHKGSLVVQLYPCKVSDNYAAPYLSNSYSDTGLGVDFQLKATITLEQLQTYFTNNNYDINTMDHFNIYIRANTVSNDFDCTVTELKFNNILAVQAVKDALEALSNEVDTAFVDHDTVAQPTEQPLEVIKRDGGLFSIFHKVGYIGDSLSSGEHEYTKDDGSTGFIDLFDYSYGQVIARATGTTALNFSSGGRTAATWLTGFATQAFDTPANICQAYVIYLGTNDMDPNKNPYGMGNVTTDVDVNNYNNNGLTFAGRYATIIQRIKAVQPKAKIFCCTVPKSPSATGQRATNPIISAIVDLFDDVYLLDLFTYAETITNDLRVGFHLSSAGYTVFAWQVMSYIDFLIRKYPSEFKEVAFIGTNYHHV